MTEIDVPDWVALLAEDRYSEAYYKGMTRTESMKAALAAALGAWVGPELNEYQRLRDGVGGCTDGGCVIKRPACTPMVAANAGKTRSRRSE